MLRVPIAPGDPLEIAVCAKLIVLLKSSLMEIELLSGESTTVVDIIVAQPRNESFILAVTTILLTFRQKKENSVLGESDEICTEVFVESLRLVYMYKAENTKGPPFWSSQPSRDTEKLVESGTPPDEGVTIISPSRAALLSKQVADVDPSV